MMKLNYHEINKSIKTQIKSKIHKVCINGLPVYDSDGRVQLYRRPDLSEWAAKAAAAEKVCKILNREKFTME